MINLQNIDVNDYFKWILVRDLHPADDHPAQTKTAGKKFAKNLDFKDTKFPVRVRYIHKIEKRILSALGILVMKIKKNIESMYQRNAGKKNILIYYQ